MNKTITILSVLLIISVIFNVLLIQLIDDKNEIIRGCEYEYNWSKRMLEEIK